MGFINLLKNGYRGKLGETVGQQWKNQLTVRTYNPTNNSKSEAQLQQREYYKGMIQISSIMYGASKGWPKNALKEMNSFNHFVSTVNEIVNINPLSPPLKQINIFNKMNVWADIAIESNQKYSSVIYQSPFINEENIKKVKVIAIVMSNDPTKKYPYKTEEVAGTFTRVYLNPTNQGVKSGEAYLFEEDLSAPPNTQVFYALKIPHKGKTYYSTFSFTPIMLPNKQKIPYTQMGQPVPAYFN